VANTIKLNFTEQGNDQAIPLVLLHGYPLSSTIWAEQQQRLSDYYRVITPDLRGHGKSDAPLGVYEMELMARDVLNLLDSLNIQKAAIMGHSMGGYVTLAAWKIASDRFAAFGMIGSQAGADSEEARQNRYKMADRVANEGSRPVAEAVIPKLFAPDLPQDEPIIEQTRAIIIGTKPDGIIGTLKGMAARPDSTEILSRINVPSLILTGDSDQLIPKERSLTMAEAIPNSTLATVENAGHMPMLEQPQATTMAIRNFLDEITGQTN
jgi:pimeloyl-ACP methyl ester carboxylesterase